MMPSYRIAPEPSGMNATTDMVRIGQVDISTSTLPSSMSPYSPFSIASLLSTWNGPTRSEVKSLPRISTGDSAVSPSSAFGQSLESPPSNHQPQLSSRLLSNSIRILANASLESAHHSSSPVIPSRDQQQSLLLQPLIQSEHRIVIRPVRHMLTLSTRDLFSGVSLEEFILYGF
ncbi:hypothetical protein BASA60_007522 [Batrachochytrium salamandrivorans]|nr:hypothetical protein BASA62_010526 [Batrachochytrium salamandrivorans]KAH6570800.1 hypothetical protein BASA60_007522 [Batrachochytrium salamandrivorans]